MSCVRLWRYRVTPGREIEFAQAYGPDGDWARLFRRGAGFLHTELLRETPGAGACLTIDRWRSAADRQGFLRNPARPTASWAASSPRFAPRMSDSETTPAGRAFGIGALCC